MKSVIVCLLLLFMNIPSGYGTQNEDDPPIFSLKNVKLDKRNPNKPQEPKEHVDREAGRVVVYDLDKNVEYLMRVDPPEHCTRFVICSVELGTTDTTVDCATAPDAILVYSHGANGGDIWQKTNPSKAHHEKSDDKVLDDYIKIKLGKQKDSNNQDEEVMEFHFKETVENIDKDKKISIKVATITPVKLKTNPSNSNSQLRGLRVETSSFYCNVHVGTATSNLDVEPTMFAFNKGQWPSPEISLVPFEYGKKLSTTLRKHFGLLFHKTKEVNAGTTSVAVNVYKVDPDAQCPFAHDWMGFARWPGASGSYKNNFWKGPVYHHHLGTGASASNCGTKRDNMYMLDIEIDNVFNPQMQYADGQRCFGFALAFGAKADDKATFTIDATKTFEFYPVAMMFLAPDSDLIRELRVSREGLRKIRISFLDNSAKTSPEDELDLAIVEYGFLNDNIAGVREYVALPKKSVTNFKAVTLFQEGYCNVRVLNVNHRDTPEKRCWNIEGCDVLKK